MRVAIDSGLIVSFEGASEGANGIHVPGYGLLDRATYGQDWIILDGADEADIREQAEAYDANQHPDQFGLTAFAALYRADPGWRALS